MSAPTISSTLSNAISPVWNFRTRFPNFFTQTFMFGMVGSLAMFITSWERADRMRDRFLVSSRDFGDTYDFIIVGGGSAGALVANRLSKMYKVLVLEVGGEPHPFTAIPFMSSYLRNYKELDWMFDTVPQTHGFFGSEGNKARISAGKGLGGTSNLDNLIYLRGNPRDFDNWARITGDGSWAYDNVKKYFMIHEKYEGPWKDKMKAFHGSTGEMQVMKPPYTKLAKRFVVAGNEMGYPYMDLNAGTRDSSEGFDMLSYPMHMGYRQGAYKSFLRGPQLRWNLKVEKYAEVKKVLFRGEEVEAYGVEYERHGKLRRAYAKKEVILSAGALNSPKLLMLSGIGDSEHLQSVGVPVKLHHPGVGKNLQDHVAVQLGPFYTKEGQTLLIDRDLSAMSLMSYGAMGQGPLSTSGYEGAALLCSDWNKASPNGDPHWPDVQLTMHSVGLHQTADEDFCHATRFKRDLISNYFRDGKGKDSFSIIVTGVRPESRGEVRLRDSNPSSSPVINPNYFSSLEDVGVIVDGIKKALRMVESTVTFQEIGATFTNKSIEGCNSYKLRSDEYWTCYTRVMSMSMGNVVGTLGMGSVVDTELKVLGTRRLRVIDASVMPTIVSAAGTLASTFMIAEKGADMIMQFWRKPEKGSTILEDSKKVMDVLNSTREKLKEVDSTRDFLSVIKQTPSYQALTPDELREASQGPLPIFYTNTNSYSGPTPNTAKLVGTMFKNSLLKAGEETTTSTTPQSVIYSSIQNLYDFANPRPVNSIHLTTSAPISSPSPSVTELFDNPHANQIHNGNPQSPLSHYIDLPLEQVSFNSNDPDDFDLPSSQQSYVLTPKPLSGMLPPPAPATVTDRKNKKTFASSVNSFMVKYNPTGLSPPSPSSAYSTLPFPDDEPNNLQYHNEPIVSASSHYGELDKFVVNLIKSSNSRLVRQGQRVNVNVTSTTPTTPTPPSLKSIPTTTSTPTPKPVVNFKLTLTPNSEKGVLKNFGMNKYLTTTTNPPVKVHQVNSNSTSQMHQSDKEASKDATTYFHVGILKGKGYKNGKGKAESLFPQSEEEEGPMKDYALLEDEKPFDLASSVQHILNGNMHKVNSVEVKVLPLSHSTPGIYFLQPSSSTSSDSDPDSISSNESKNLDDEVKKLIEHKGSSAKPFYIIPTPIKNSPPQFTHVIHDMIRTHVRNKQKLEMFQGGNIQGHGQDGLPGGGGDVPHNFVDEGKKYDNLSSQTIAAMQERGKEMFHEMPRNNGSLLSSFRIKILNRQ